MESKVEEPLVLKPGPGVATKRKPQPPQPLAEPVEPASSFEVASSLEVANSFEIHETQSHLNQGVFELAHQQLTPGTEPKDPEWKEVRGRRSARPKGTPKPPKPPTPISETLGILV